MSNIPTVTVSRPINFRGALKDFKQGQLCFVVARRYLGKGSVRLILHKAELSGPNAAYGYGCFGHWIVSAGSLMGVATSDAKAKSSAKNGRKGGRPKKK